LWKCGEPKNKKPCFATNGKKKETDRIYDGITIPIFPQPSSGTTLDRKNKTDYFVEAKKCETKIWAGFKIHPPYMGLG